MAKKKKKDKKRVDLDVRPYPSPIWRNYDYGGPTEGESEVSPGRGLYSGDMSKYKSTREFIEKSRKRMKKKRKRALQLLQLLGNDKRIRFDKERIKKAFKRGYSEIGANAINYLRKAVFAIEKEISDE